jgi:hypothetical protein
MVVVVGAKVLPQFDTSFQFIGLNGHAQKSQCNDNSSTLE